MDYMSLFPGSSREHPRFTAFAGTVLRQAEDLAALAASLQPGFSFASAEGVQLDALAEAVGLSREDTSAGAACTDEQFRAFLRAKLALWGWDGTNGTAPAVLAAAGITKEQRDAMNGSVRITSGGTMPKASIPQVFPYPAGVSWLLVLEDETDPGHT